MGCSEGLVMVLRDFRLNCGFLSLGLSFWDLGVGCSGFFVFRV